MASLSQRAQRLPASPIRRLAPLADAAKRAGKTVYHLNIGQPDISTFSGFMKGATSLPKVVAYSPSQGLFESRKALSDYYAQHNIQLSPEQIIVTSGGSEALVFALMSVCDPGDEILIPEPFYANYGSYAVASEVTVKPITTYAADGFRLPDRAAIESQVSQRTKAILCCSPGNPTGTVYSREDMERLRDVALANDLFLISDEVYREFVYHEQGHVSLMHLEGIDACGIMVDSISKRFSACGARIGCLASRNPVLLEAVLKFGQARLSPSVLGELGLIQALNDPQTPAEMERMIERFRARRDVLYAGLNAIPGVRCHNPEGAFYVIAKLPVDDSEAFARWLLSEFDLDGATVMLAPAAGFYATPGLGRDEVRIAYVLNRKALGHALEVLKAALAAYPGTHAGVQPAATAEP